MSRAPSAGMIDTRQLGMALDLWQCMWEPEARERFETAVVRTMTDENPPGIRLQALTLCHIVATPRLVAAAERVAEMRRFSDVDIAAIAILAEPLHARLAAAAALRGDLFAVEDLIESFLGEGDAAADALLEWIDVRDLVAVARLTSDGRLFAEVVRRLARRGRHQQRVVAERLGFPGATGEHEIVAIDEAADESADVEASGDAAARSHAGVGRADAEAIESADERH